MRLSTGQIRELLAIDAAGRGIGREVQELIARLSSGGVKIKSDNVRHIQAKRLWNLGFGQGFASFPEYLATIPQIPKSLLGDDPELPMLSLADPRPGLVAICQMAGVEYNPADSGQAIPLPGKPRLKDPTEPFWFRHDDGRPNRNRKPNQCLRNAKSGTIAGTALTGIMAFLHHPGILSDEGFCIDLPGSVSSTRGENCGSIRSDRGVVVLEVNGCASVASKNSGALRVRRE